MYWGVEDSVQQREIFDPFLSLEETITDNIDPNTSFYIGLEASMCMECYDLYYAFTVDLR